MHSYSFSWMEVSSQLYKRRKHCGTQWIQVWRNLTAWPNIGKRSKVTGPAWNQTPVTQPSRSWPNQYHQSNNKLKPSTISLVLAFSHLT